MLRTVLALAVTALFAVVVVVGVNEVVRGYEAQLDLATAPDQRVIQVLVAAHEMLPGHVIVAEDLIETELRREYLPSAALHKEELIVGRTVMERIASRDLIRLERLASPEASAGLNAVIPDGMRALSINIADAGQVSGFVNPGNRVDVVATVMPDEGEPETTTLMQVVRVLAVNERTEEEKEVGFRLKPQVTLAVTPADAERVTHALREGEVRLVLRSDVDTEHFGTRGARTSELLGGTEGAQRMTVQEWREAAAGEVSLVHVIHGDKVVTEELRSGLEPGAVAP